MEQDVAVVDPPPREVAVSRPHRDLSEWWYACCVLGGAHGHRLTVDGDDLVVVDMDMEWVPLGRSIADHPLLSRVEANDLIIAVGVEDLAVDLGRDRPRI